MFAVFCVNCSQQTIPVVEATKIETPSPTPQIIKSEAKITNEKAKGLKVTETFLPSKENLSKVYFADENNGWIVENISKNNSIITSNLYKTIDAGKTWEKTVINIPKGSRIQDIFFVNQSVGWIIFQIYADVWEKKEKQNWLMKTTDGGITWQTLLENRKMTLDQVIFTDENNGWMIGTKDEGLIYRTTNGGLNWTDVSPGIYKLTNKYRTRTDMIGLVAESPKKAKVVTFGREFFKTDDEGKTWKQFGFEFNEDYLPAQVTTENFGNAGNNLLRVAGGADSKEGIFSYLANEEGSGSWKLRWFKGDDAFCLIDVVYLSENKIFVCGRIYADEKMPNLTKRIRNPVIYYSSDSGDTWYEAYKTSQFKEINSISSIFSIAKVSDNHIIAVGNNGLIINIEIEKPEN